MMSEPAKVYDEKKLKFNEKIGNGSFGIIFNVEYDNSPFVAKRSHEEEDDKYLKKEYEILKFLEEKHVCGVPKASFMFSFEGRWHFLLERLGTDLAKEVEKQGNLSLRTTLDVAIQALKILESIHKCAVIHNDLKPKNLMFGIESPPNLYLIDFGVSTANFTNEDNQQVQNLLEIDGKSSELSYSQTPEGACRKGDLKMLALTLIQVRTGDLRAQHGDIEGLEKEFEAFLEDVENLSADVENTVMPDYSLFCSKFKNVLKNKKN